MAATLTGGALAAGGANAINMVVDCDIDRIPDLRAGPRAGGFRRVVAGRQPALGRARLSATLFYVFVYTLRLQRCSSQTIVIGEAAGAVPVQVGRAAVTDTLARAPVVLFAIILIWTPPHF
jgi:heme o synthase